MPLNRSAISAVTLVLGGTLCSLPAAVPPQDEDGTVLEKPLWLSVRLVRGYGHIAIRPGIDFQKATFSGGIKRTISGRLDLVKERYVGQMKIVEETSKSQIMTIREGRFEFELDKPQTSDGPFATLNHLSWTLVLSRERDKWNQLFKRGSAAEALSGGPGGTGPVPQ